MADRNPTNSHRRTKPESERTVQKLWKRLNRQLSLRQVALGLGIALAVASLVIGFDFRRLPTFELGEIADRDVVAFRDFTVEDEEATEAKREESLSSVPAVFDLDMSISTRLESALRNAFTRGREVLAARREKWGVEPGSPIPQEHFESLVEEMAAELPTLAGPDSIIPVLVESEFAPSLEDQMSSLLLEAMQAPGVMASRDSLSIFRERGIILRNTVTRQDMMLADPSLVKNLTQARALIRQNEFQLTSVDRNANLSLITFLEDRVVPTVRFNSQETSEREALALDQVPPVLIQIKQGRTILRAGDEVNARHMMILREMQKEVASRQTPSEFFGIFLLGLFFVLAMWQYMQTYPEHMTPKPAFLLMAVVLLMHLIVARVHVLFANLLSVSLTIDFLKDPGNLYGVVPVAFGSILLVLLAGGQIAVLYAVVLSVFVALMCGNMIFGIYALVSSLTAVYALRQYRERSAMGVAGLLVGCANIFALFALHLLTTTFQWNVFAVSAGLGFAGGMISVMLASLLLPLLEQLFEITTDIRLLELSNLNKPILRKLALDAPGTYHHSLNVGVLAEAAAEAIGANPLLTRVGAYYHDIGKMKKAEYYVENQIYMSNKHENLSPRMSSLILISHVKDGLELAKEIGLAPKVAALIPQHHGTKLISFFYQKATKALEDKALVVDEEEFRYPGPKPQSKEAAILMLADQVEAASRTLQKPNPGQIRSLIRRLIQGTIEDRQFDECDITTRDLHLITTTFERIITGMHHHRIEYPGYEFNKQGEKRQPQNQRVQ